MSDYERFLARKKRTAAPTGRTVSLAGNPGLHPWQAEIVEWACAQGRAAIFSDTGTGKTRMQVAWAELMRGDGVGLLVAPLAVTRQTIREAARLGLDVRYVTASDGITGPGLWITNYERVDAFDPAALACVVLDESSILKASDGKTRTRLIQTFAGVPYRLACSATPAPNDPEELTNQAEFLGVATRVNMLAAYFVHDSDGWRLKGHARSPMFRWMASWAVAIRRPSDMGYPDDGYILPGLQIVGHIVDVPIEQDGQLFPTDLGGVGGRAAVRRATMQARCEQAVTLVNATHGLSSHGTKLAAWDGSPNTPQTGEPSTPPTQRNESGERLRGEAPSATRNTCASTTEPTRTSSSNTSGTPGNVETPAAVSGTQPTPSTEPSACAWPSYATESPCETADCAEPSGSLPPSTTSDSGCSRGDAPFAAPGSEMPQAVGSPSTTVTRPDVSAGSSAANATLGWGSSETTPRSSFEQSSTSLEQTRLEPWVVWCGLNDEQSLLERAFGDRAFSVRGNQSAEEKADLLFRWLDGERPILLTKPSIAGAGINMQHCARMLFVGMSDSYEGYYQAIRRCYRYGQTRVVDVHIVLSELEGQIAANVRRKETEAAMLAEQMVAAMREGKATA